MIISFIIEVGLMLDATTFLSFGISEVNDIVDNERRHMGKSWCITDDVGVSSYHSFCGKHSNKSQPFQL
jgi:hypothetical protein